MREGGLRCQEEKEKPGNELEGRGTQEEAGPARLMKKPESKEET